MNNSFHQKALTCIQKNWVLAIVYLPIFWTLAFSFTVPNGRSIASKLLVISAIFSLFYFKKNVLSFIRKPKQIKIILSCLLILITFRSCMFLYHGEHTSSIRAFSIIFLYIYAFPYWLVKKKHIEIIITSSSLLMGIDALIHIANNGFIRYGGNTNPNPYGLYSALLFITTYIYIINNFKERLYFIIPFSIISFLPLFASQSRGVWLSIIVVLCIYHIKNIKLSKNKLIIMILSILIFIYSAYQIPMISQRVNYTLSEIQNIENNNLNSSMGIRLQVWEASIPLIKENLFFGLGNKLQEININRFKNNEISQISYYYSRNHLHNQYIDLITKQGAIGLLFFMSLTLAPLVWLVSTQKKELKQISSALLILLLINFITEVPFNWINFTYGYFILLLYLLLLSNIKRKNIKA